VVRAVVSPISDLAEAHGRDGCRAWACDFCQLHLALGPGVRSGNGQALPSALAQDEPKLAPGRDVHQHQGTTAISVPSCRFHRADHRFSADRPARCMAAERFLHRLCGTKATRCHGSSMWIRTRPIPVPWRSKARGTISRRCQRRQCKYLNNIVEQDHRNVKRRTSLAKGYGSLQSAWRTLRGIEAMEMVRKGRARWIATDDVVGQGQFIRRLFGIAA
jgi:DDE domain